MAHPAALDPGLVLHVILALLALLALGAVGLSVAGTVGLLRRQRAALAASPEDPPPDDAVPPTAVVVPVRGEHQGLADNVRALLAQDHPDLEWVFVVDDRGDAAVPVLEGVLKEDRPHPARLVSVQEVEAEDGDLGDFRIGKARAHAAALARIADDREVVLFADADVRPRPDWARRLTAPLAGDPGPGPPDPDVPLADRPVGATTTFRWYLSERRGFWSRVRAQWNAVGHDALLSEDHRFCWGGSMAVRRDVLERCGVVERMRTYVTDDVALSDAVNEHGYRVAHDPRAAVATVEGCDREACVEWCVRQAALVKASLPRLWSLSLAIYALAVGLFVVGAGLVGVGLGLPPVDPWLAAAGAAMMVPVLSNPLRTRARWSFFREVLTAPWEREALDREPDLPGLALGQPFFMLMVLLRSARLDAVEWRGRTYPLDGGGGGAR